MARQIPWRKSLGARLGLLSVAILASAILLIVADFRMLGEIDAARAQTNVLGHDRSDAYQLLALTERLARDTGRAAGAHAGEISDVRGQIDRRFESIRGGGPRPGKRGVPLGRPPGGLLALADRAGAGSAHRRPRPGDAPRP